MQVDGYSLDAQKINCINTLIIRTLNQEKTTINGHKCTYRKQWSEDKINAAVREIIRKLVNNPKFKTEIQKHLGQSIDT